MGEGRAVQLMCGAHHFLGEGCGCILDQGDVIAKLHREAAGGFDAGVGQQADHDHPDDPLLLQPEIKIGVRKTALPPMFLDDDVAFLMSFGFC